MTHAKAGTNSVRLRPARRLDGLSPYVPPAPQPFVDLVLDANEGAGPAESFAALLSQVEADDVRRYPSAAELERSIAETLGVAAQRVVVTNGADDAIDRVCRAVLEPGRICLTHSPTFEMIGRSAGLAEGTGARGEGVRTIGWMNGPFPTQEFLRSISVSTALVALVSPNNPTGGVIKRDEILQVVRAAGEVGSLVMVDFAYVEFADEDPTEDLLDEPNVVVVRTFSKALGLAGARVGYAVSSAEVAGWLRTVGGPYPVSSVSAKLAGASLGAGRERAGFISAVRSERGAFVELLQQYGCETLDSQANFVTAKFADAAFVQRGLASLGISVRAFASRPEFAGFLRITLPGDRGTFERVCSAIRTILDPQAILFDLDGVLADVSGSYREAIIESARTFGVEITADEIGQAKRAGDANNDWVLTKRLLEQRGVACKLDDVVARFQKVYLGSDGQPGLRDTERLIPDTAFLDALSDRFTLGVVTGRPREEARVFLDRAGIRGLFSTLVCMEDAPAKPSPEPVLRALEDLKVEQAWMIGDTPDDITAARCARVLPIGVPAPGDDPAVASESMFRVGASSVLPDVSKLEEMIR